MNEIQQSINLIDQLIDTITLLTNDQYKRSLSLYSGSSIGKHCRHVYDFYKCLINGYRHDFIDYTCRSRDLRMENDIETFSYKFNEIKAALNSLDSSAKVRVRSDFGSKTDFVSAYSTIGRELFFVYDHAIHHMAMIKMGIESSVPNFEFQPSFGIAPSTLHHQKDNIVE